MKKRLILLLSIVMFLFVPIVASAQSEYNDDFKNSVPLDQSLLSGDVDLNDPESIKEDIQFISVLSYLWDLLKKSAIEAIQVLPLGIALILLSVLLNRCSAGFQRGGLQTMISFLISISVVLLCRDHLSNAEETLQKAIENMNVFSMACIPSFSVVMLAAGEGGAATVFSGTLVFLGQIGALISKNLMVPLVDIYLCIGICSTISDEFNFSSIARNIRKFLFWLIGIFISIFKIILRLQSVAATAGDQITKKYIRAAIGGLVPVVGNTLSQGVDGLFSIASGVKTSFAVAGVLLVLSIMLPILVRLLLFALSWSLCRWIAEFMGDSFLRSIAEVLAGCFYLMIGLGGCVALMGLFSFFGVMTQLGV